MPERTAFCYGSAYRVTEVMNFTQPSASGGVTMTRINYNLEIENPDDWLANTWTSYARRMDVATLRSTPRRLREDLRTIRGDMERTATLVLTNQGWKHNSEI